jgi:hypothetical protein
MFITNEQYKNFKVTSIDEPIPVDYFWILDLQEQDWMLSKLVMLEEFTTPTLTLNIKGHLIELPAEWNILVYSPETSDVDMVQISDLTKSEFVIFLYDYKTSKVIEHTAKVVNYSPSSTVRTPSFNKSNMLCYPIAERYWIMVAPTDTYNKYLKDSITVGNFLY